MFCSLTKFLKAFYLLIICLLSPSKMIRESECFRHSKIIFKKISFVALGLLIISFCFIFIFSLFQFKKVTHSHSITLLFLYKFTILLRLNSHSKSSKVMTIIKA